MWLRWLGAVFGLGLVVVMLGFCGVECSVGCDCGVLV